MNDATHDQDRAAWVAAIQAAEDKIAAALAELEAATGVQSLSINPQRVEAASTSNAQANPWSVTIELNAR